MTMKRVYIIIATVLSLSVLSVQPADAQFLRGLLRFCGVSEDSPWMGVADVGDAIGNAIVGKNVDSVLGTYGQQAADDYNQFVRDYNERKNKESEQYLSEENQYKMEYCKSHGFYDSWVEQYGDDWFEKAGREWFNSRDAEVRRRAESRERIIQECMDKPEDQWTWYEKSVVSEGVGETSLLPWHLRGDSRDNRLGDFKSTVLGAVGLSMDDVDRAKQWETGDKYDRQDMVINSAVNVIKGFDPSRAQLIDTLGKLVKINNQYNKVRGSDKPAAITQRNIDLANIVFSAIWEKNENRKQYVANSLDLSSVLSDAGFEGSSGNANDLAGVVMSIQNNDSMTQEEKNQWYNDLGIKSNAQTVVNTVSKVNDMTDQQIAQSLKPIDNGPSPEEIRAKEEAERLERERIARDDAVSTVNQTVVDSYKFDITDLTLEQKTDLDRIAETMSKYADLQLEIKGHTCDIGATSVNDRVGLRRAETAKAYLVEKGIASNRISTVSGGEKEPAVENTSSDNRKQNRRLTFEFQ